MTGNIPDLIDHKDRNPLNNKWDNLRAATKRQNRANSKAIGKTGFKGVSIRTDNFRKKKYRAQLNLVKKHLHLGYFHTAEEAAEAYDKAAIEHFGEFANLNFKGIV